MTNKEKEKAYDEALERAKKYYSTTNSAADTELIELIFPELKGSDDEKVRKALIDYFKRYDMCWTETFNGVPTDKILAWLEKQGEQKASYTTTVEIGNGGINALVTGELSTNGCDYDEKPACVWSEEDDADAWMNDIVSKAKSGLQLNKAEINWLKSLRPQTRWKPSDEQMTILYKYAEQNNYDGSILTALYNELKKLREE